MKKTSIDTLIEEFENVSLVDLSQAERYRLLFSPMSISEAARLFNVSRQTIHDWGLGHDRLCLMDCLDYRIRRAIKGLPDEQEIRAFVALLYLQIQDLQSALKNQIAENETLRAGMTKDKDHNSTEEEAVREGGAEV